MPFMPWPGADGLHTETMHAWWFDAHPMPRAMPPTDAIEQIRTMFEQLGAVMQNYPDPARRLFFHIMDKYGAPDEVSEGRIVWRAREGWSGAMVVPASSME
jgi:hypothetical protein